MPVDLLQPHDEHRAVRFLEDGRPHFDDVVGPNGEEEPIERRVMQLVERDAVADDRLAFGVAIGRDVCRVQKLLMPESTERSALGVRSNHPLTEGTSTRSSATASWGWPPISRIGSGTSGWQARPGAARRSPANCDRVPLPVEDRVDLQFATEGLDVLPEGREVDVGSTFEF